MKIVLETCSSGSREKTSSLYIFLAEKEKIKREFKLF
jgi:hypothetical protein